MTMAVITLTTDFGSSTPAVGSLHGAIWRAAPGARIVDLTHEIPPRDQIAAQVVLENVLPYFPDGTIHMAVVHTTAYSGARALAGRLGPMFFVGPDTGLVTPLLERAEANRWKIEIYHASREAYSPAGSEPAHTVFAPLAAHLALGLPLDALGERINNPLRTSIPAPDMLEDGWRGQVIQVDHFGNLAANIRRAHLEGMGAVLVRVGGRVIEGLSSTFGDGRPGDLIAMIDSTQHLSICVVNGSAASFLNAGPGDTIEVHSLKPSPPGAGSAYN